MSAFMHFVTVEWYFAVPMFLMSFVAVTLVIWRILLNLDARTNLNDFLPRFQKVLDLDGPDAALAFARKEKGVIARKLIPAGLETRPQGVSAMRRAMASVIELEVIPDLNFLLAPILAIAKVATMVGLLGTVISMIGTFQKIRESKDPTGHSSAIGLALFATALRLVTAMPLAFRHARFKAWVLRFALTM